MSEETFKDIYEQALSWVSEAGQALSKAIKQTIQVEYKTSVNDLVTAMDRQTEQFFVQKIKAHYPDHRILGEEGMAGEETFDPQQEIVWIIDPIDGTTNFVHMKRHFAISIGIFERGEPRIGIIYDPVAKECFSALNGAGAYLNEQPLKPLEEGTVERAVLGINGMWLVPNRHGDDRKMQNIVQNVRGVRSICSAALEMAYVASGRLDGYLSLHLKPWDFAGGLVILKELGARLSTVNGETLPVFEPTSVFVARPKLHEEILDTFLA